MAIRPSGSYVIEKPSARAHSPDDSSDKNAGMPYDSSTQDSNLNQPQGTDEAGGAIQQPSDTSCGLAFLHSNFCEGELVLGLVGAVGAKLRDVVDKLKARLEVIGYDVQEIRVSHDIIPMATNTDKPPSNNEFERINCLMDAGNRARKESEDNSVLALGVAAWISSKRAKVDGGHRSHSPKKAYIINSLKHPEEIARLRQIYPQGFYLLGVHSDHTRRSEYLVQEKRMTKEQAAELMERDEDEHLPHGQQVRDTFHMSDFFVRLDANDDKLNESIWRILDIIYGSPYLTPTFDEYAMFFAFAASLRSADLSRQVGAVVAHHDELLSTGANECPRFGGGLYWAKLNDRTGAVQDEDLGRDYMRGEDANRSQQIRMIEDIVKIGTCEGIDGDKLRLTLERSPITDITEYGRAVHAEMEALLCCARNHVSTRGATLYCTTFPCHNCAKHIIAAGIERVVYIEPYPKSRAAELHDDAVLLGFNTNKTTVHFEPFFGIGPRRFFELFSMKLGSGYPIPRKDRDGQVLKWEPEGSRLRIQMLPCSYLDLEIAAANMFENYVKPQEIDHGNGQNE